MAHRTFKRIYIIIICIHLIVSNAGAVPLVNENNDALLVSMQYNENTRMLQRIVQLSQGLDSQNELEKINIFVPTNDNRFDSWGG